MLTSDLLLTRSKGPYIEPRWIDAADAENLALAEDLIAIFAKHEGQNRGTVKAALDAYAGDRVDYRVQRGLAKLLYDHYCEFEIRSAKPAEEIRSTVFALARENHPILRAPTLLHPVARADVIGLAAMKLEIAPEQVEEGLYADLIENHMLAKFEPPEPRALLDRYNVALAQAMFYKCGEMRLSVRRNLPARYKQLFKFIKFYRLIHSVNGDLESGYEVVLDGPASMFRHTQKYGLQMSLFLPALLLCTKWKMRADIRRPDGPTREFVLESEKCDLVSHYKGSLKYDSLLEETFAKRFEAAKTEWALERETEIIDLKETVMIPDFAFRHPDGRSALLEIVGYWRPDYLRRKLEKVRQSKRRDLIIAVSSKLNVSEEDFAQASEGPVFFFKERIQPKDVLERLEKVEMAPF